MFLRQIPVTVLATVCIALVCATGCGRPGINAQAGDQVATPPSAGTTILGTTALTATSQASAGSEGLLPTTPPTSAETSLPARALSPAELSEAKQWAWRAASANGDANPTGGQAVLSTRALAAKALFAGTQVDSNQPVVVAVVYGAFNTSGMAPPGASVSTKDELVVVFDLTDGHGVDLNLLDTRTTDGQVDLSSLGPVSSL